ncbi:membrane hypothetical protein [uncultured Defluviicoccus sp.]|uniref:Membrane protein involved in the export of O-antigen and teichoic acid n=1 Tax=metagenome TaxID=256318 RepID=A0A380TKR2_9ZZZZ|nr:membrane hypothetical protein [uncultured Defluviicoccus sp.]
MCLAVATTERLVTVAILVRVWGICVFSDWSVLCAVAGLFALAELGTNVYFSNRYQALVARGDKPRLQKNINIAFTVSIALSLGCILAAIVLFFNVSVRSALGIACLSLIESRWLIILLVLDFCIRLPLGALSELYRAIGLFARSQLLYSLLTIGRIAVFCLVWLINLPAVWAAFLLLIPPITLGWLLYFWDIRRFEKITICITRISLVELQQVLKTSKWYAAQSWSTHFWNQLPPILLATYAGSGEAVATFVILRTLSSSVRQIPALFGVSAAIELARLLFSGSKSVLQKKIGDIGKIYCTLSGLAAGALLGFGEQVFRIWTASAHLFDGTLLLLLTIPILLTGLGAPLSLFLHYGNFARQVGMGRVLQLSLLLPLATVMTALWGVHGCAVGLAVSEIVAVGGYVLVAGLRASGTSFRAYAAKCTPALVSAFGWSWFGAFAVRQIVADETVVGLLVALGAWGLAAAAPILWLAVSRDRRRAFWQEARRALRGLK